MWRTELVQPHGRGDHDTTSLRILADILGYQLKYLRGRCSRGEVSGTHPSADGTNLMERVDTRARERAVDEERREVAQRERRWKG